MEVCLEPTAFSQLTPKINLDSLVSIDLNVILLSPQVILLIKNRLLYVVLIPFSGQKFISDPGAYVLKATWD